MTYKFVDHLKVVGSAAGAGVFNMGVAFDKECITLSTAVANGDLTAGDQGVPFDVTDGLGAWEISLFDITSSTQITRRQVLRSSAGGATIPTYTGTTLTIYNTVPATYLNGVAVNQLSTITTVPPDYVQEWLNPATGQSYQITYANLEAQILAKVGSGGTATPTPSITVNTPAAQTAGTAFAVTGAYSGYSSAPTALDYSTDGGSTWTQASAPTISAISGGGGTYSISGVVISAANASASVKVRDHNSIGVVGTSGTFAVNAAAALPAYTLTGYPGTNGANAIKPSSPAIDLSVAANYTFNYAPAGKGLAVDKTTINNNGYWYFKRASDTAIPARVVSGWFPLGVTPTEADVLHYSATPPTPNQNSNGGSSKNGLVSCGFNAGNGNFVDNAILWIPAGDTRKWCEWFVAVDPNAATATFVGQPVNANPAGLSFTGA
jgi:hypothetical protein